MAQLVPARADVELMEGYHSPQVSVDVRLNTNESPYPPPAAWVEDLQQELAEVAYHRYPDRAATALREALAAQHGVRADQVFCGNGSNEVLEALFLAYGGPGRTAAVFEPTYALHSHIARITGTGVLEGQRNADFTLDWGEVERVLKDEPTLTFLCSPNNPTGRSESRATVEKVLAAAPGLVVVDEAYGQFAPWSALELIDDERGLVVVRTFSKTWSMAAFRLGYLVGPASLVDALHKVALPYHLDAVKQAAGRLALKYKPEMEARVASLVEERGKVTAALADLPVESWPSEANFILFRPIGVDGRAVWQGLLDRSILIRDCTSWPNLDGCLRVTIGTAAENEAFIAALTEVLGA